MIESWSVSGCWGPRQEPTEACARRWARFFNAFEAVHADELRSWVISGGTTPTDVTPLSLDEARLAVEVEDGSAGDDLGFTFGAWNGRDGASSVSFMSSCGGTSDAVLNNAFLGLQAATNDDIRRWARLAGPLLTALAEAWEPDWGYFVSDAVRDQQERPDPRSPVAGHLTYLSAGRRNALPRHLDAQVIDIPSGGVLISLIDGEGGLRKPKDVLRLAETLARSGAFAPTPEDKPVLSSGA